MLINLFLDFVNFYIIIYLIVQLIKNFREYKNGLRNMRLAILIGIFFLLQSELLLFANTVSNMFSIMERDYLFSHWQIRTLLRLGILVGLIVFGGIVNNSDFKFMTLTYWKTLYSKAKDKINLKK